MSCPNCGYCPTCKRPKRSPYYIPPYYPYYPYQHYPLQVWQTGIQPNTTPNYGSSISSGGQVSANAQQRYGNSN